eukprot:TRINITY_DN11555_c0_g1_i2.p3 TRINITY_DN11555_c0_g1~~TRINITY_DN11555_c0_g1_i2.p3  ORF type:complete len:110 (-),score=5.78 TRINITY_DN11555_c0_g1_i2:154-483(-)
MVARCAQDGGHVAAAGHPGLALLGRVVQLLGEDLAVLVAARGLELQAVREELHTLARGEVGLDQHTAAMGDEPRRWVEHQAPDGSATKQKRTCSSMVEVKSSVAASPLL